MTPLIVVLALTAAVLHASWNAAVKSNAEPLYTIAGFQIVGAVICLGLLGFFPAPHVESWPMIVASVVIHNIYYFTLAQAYRAGDLSQVYPIFRGLAPVLVACGAAVFAGELLKPSQFAGIAIVSVGIMSLALGSRGGDRVPRQALVWGLATSFLIATYTIVDGIGVRASESSLGYILWLFVLEPVPVVTILLMTRRRAFVDFLKTNKVRCLIGGTVSSTAYGLVIFAMGLGAMALVSTLRETSVIFAAFIGAFVLKEKFGARRIAAATIVAAGVMTLHVLG